MVISLISCLSLVIFFRFFTPDWHKAAFCAGILTILFFTYGHVYMIIKPLTVFNLILGRHRYLLLVWFMVAGVAVIYTTRKRGDFKNHTLVINMISLALQVYPIYTIGTHFFAVRDASSSYSQPIQDLDVGESQQLPDIYFIILDSYARSDLLKEEYGYDNTSFLNNLKEVGFYIADCGTSNYMWTNLSISSVLNMEYLQVNPVYLSTENKDAITEELLKNSLVRNTVESLGYKTVAFATGFPFNEIDDADIYMEPPYQMEIAREFDALLVHTTLLKVFQDYGLIHVNQTATARYRDRTLFALNKLGELAKMGGPKFVYMHIIAPHPPFVFGGNGESVDPFEFVIAESAYTPLAFSKGYIDQVKFISGRISSSIRELIRNSPVPPVIVIQGDHGPWFQDGENNFRILSAYYFPEHQDVLYPSISQINTFRIILSTYLNADYPPLEDISYRSLYGNKYEFSLQPISCENAK